MSHSRPTQNPKAITHNSRRVVALVDSEARMGGVEFSTLYLAEQIDRTLFQPLVICPEEGDLPAQCRQKGIPVRIVPRPRTFSTSLHLPQWGIQNGYGRRTMAGFFGRQSSVVGRPTSIPPSPSRTHYVPNPLAWAANLGAFLVAAQRLAKALRRYRVDLVCTKGMQAHFYGGLAAKLAGLPCVWHVQDLVSERAGKLYARVLGWNGRMLARQIIADGGTIRDQLAPYLPAGRLSVIHNGVDTDLFSPQVDGTGVRREWGIENGSLLIGNIARLTPWKGQDHLLRAFAMVAADFPCCNLVLVGSPVFDSDTYEHELRALAREVGVEERVIFAGYRWDLPQVLAALDIFVHSSVEKDTSPLTVVSAMAAGKAILSTNVAGVAELFGQREAILVPPANSIAMAAVLRAMLSSCDLRHELGKAARREAELSLSLPQFARRCEAIFTKAIGH